MLKSSPKPLGPPAQKKSASTLNPAEARAQIKSLIHKNLLASPEFPRLYADTVLHYFPNSNEAKILAPHYKKITEWVKAEKTKAEKAKTEKTTAKPEETKMQTTTKQERSTMPSSTMTSSNVTKTTSKDCAHIKVTGVRCGSPALRGEQFCYFHQRMIRGVKTPPASRLHPMALIEDEESIQASLMEVINALVRNHIDTKRAELILRALNTAVRNARRVRFQAQSTEMVREVPDYPAPPQAPKPAPGKIVVPVSNRTSGYAEVKEVEVKEVEVNEVAQSAATTGAPFLARTVREKWDSTNADTSVVDTNQRKPPSSVNKLPASPRKAQSAPHK